MRIFIRVNLHLNCEPVYRSDENQGGKSGQQRAAHPDNFGVTMKIVKTVPQKITTAMQIAELVKM